jgi:hypothetical protein
MVVIIHIWHNPLVSNLFVKVGWKCHWFITCNRVCYPCMFEISSFRCTTKDKKGLIPIVILFFLYFDTWVKAHYNGQRLLSQILLFETTCFWISTKLILKQFFANNTWKKVVPNPKNKFVKNNFTLKLILNDWKNCNHTDIL